MAWAIWLLGRHTEARAAMEAEVDTLEGRTPAFSDLPNLPLCRGVFGESLRLYPPSFAIPRQAARSLEISGAGRFRRAPWGCWLPGSPIVTQDSGTPHWNSRHPDGPPKPRRSATATRSWPSEAGRRSVWASHLPEWTARCCSPDWPNGGASNLWSRRWNWTRRSLCDRRAAGPYVWKLAGRTRRERIPLQRGGRNTPV